MLVSPQVRVLDLEWTFTRNTPIWEMPCNVIPCQFVWFPEGRPHLYRDEMAVFIWDEFEVLVTTWSIFRALKYEGWSKKVSKQKARERNVNFRDAYVRFISDFSSYHLVYVDESGCDKWIGFRMAPRFLESTNFNVTSVIVETSPILFEVGLTN